MPSSHIHLQLGQGILGIPRQSLLEQLLWTVSDVVFKKVVPTELVDALPGAGIACFSCSRWWCRLEGSARGRSCWSPCSGRLAALGCIDASRDRCCKVSRCRQLTSATYWRCAFNCYWPIVSCQSSSSTAVVTVVYHLKFLTTLTWNHIWWWWSRCFSTTTSAICRIIKCKWFW